MTDTPTRTQAASAPWLRVAGWAALASGLAGIPMVLTLVAMYAGFALGPDARATALRLGAINDALAILVYGLALPVVPGALYVGYPAWAIGVGRRLLRGR